MQKIYHSDSYCQKLETSVNGVSTFDGRTELCFEDLLFHPSGGGQPDDFGRVTIQGKTFNVLAMRKQKGEIRVVLDDDGSIANETGFGDTAICELDWNRRFRLMRLHSAAHILMAAARSTASGYVPGGMRIADDIETAMIRFRRDRELSNSEIDAIFERANETVLLGHEITAFQFPGIDAAKDAGGKLFRMDPAVQLKGAVRIIKIDGIDFNPCSGTHVRNTAEISGVKMLAHRSIDQFTELQYTLITTCAA